MQSDAVWRRYFVQLSVLPALERLEPAEALLLIASSKPRPGGGSRGGKGGPGAHVPRHGLNFGHPFPSVKGERDARRDPPQCSASGTGTVVHRLTPAPPPPSSAHARTSWRLPGVEGDRGFWRRRRRLAARRAGSRKQRAPRLARLRTGRGLPAGRWDPPLALPSVVT